MALFSLHVHCDGIGSYSTQCQGDNPYDAIRVFLKKTSLNEFLAPHPEWPRDFKLRDIYLFIPLDWLTNIYFCDLGQKGKYVQIDIVQTVQHSSDKILRSTSESGEASLKQNRNKMKLAPTTASRLTEINRGAVFILCLCGPAPHLSR